jgi:FkbM family methyltransferase
MFDELPATPQAFHNNLLIKSLAALKLNTFLDNFDQERFNLDGNDHSKTFNAGERAFYFDWFLKNSENLFSAYSLLNDECSKRLYLFLIAYRLAGHFSVRLPVSFAGKTEEYAAYKAVEKSTPSELPTTGMFGNLRHFDFEHQGKHYVADCVGLDYYLFRGQYFYQRGGISIAPEAGDTVIDGGACTGDTAAVFSNAVGPSGSVLCFDPVANHLAVLDHNVKQFAHPNVRIMPYGLSDKNVVAAPIELPQYSPGFRPGNLTIPLRSIDFLVNTKEISTVNFIKLDVEGAELESIRGARESILRFKPKLAISLYHNPNDIFELIIYIKEKFPFYSLYLDHYTIHAEETVLYCLP